MMFLKLLGQHKNKNRTWVGAVGQRFILVALTIFALYHTAVWAAGAGVLNLCFTEN